MTGDNRGFNMRLIISLGFAILFFAIPASAQSGPQSGPLSAGEPALQRVDAAGSVNEVMQRLVNAVEARGMSVMVRINHGAGAHGIGTVLPESQLLIFGNPRLGAALMLRAPEMGLDLPIRMLVLEAADGTTRILWHSPAALFAKWGLSADLPQLAAMTGALEAIATEAAAAP
jgi:uncharacterized protein (DUF302 family)